MAEETKKQEEREDLSKLKGPKWWFGWSALLGVAVAVLLFSYIGNRGVGDLATVLAFFGTILSGGMGLIIGMGWWFCNHVGYTVCWWKDGDTCRVTAQGYPEKAKGLVIEVQVKARPRFTLRWGAKGWHSKDDGEHSWFVNLRGERILDAMVSKAALDSEGLTEKVCGFLRAAGRLWRVIPLDAGRTLRFVDSCGKGVEVFWNGLDGVDLEEIMRSRDCADYHRRMQEKARDYAEAYRLMYEVFNTLDIPSPVYDETLAVRLGQVKEAGARLCAKLEGAWAELCLVLNTLHKDMESAGRPKAKMAVARRVELLMKFLHEHLPAGHRLRAGSGISQEALDKVAALIAAQEAQLKPDAPEVRPGGVGTEA